MDNLNMKFMKEISKTTDPVVFLGMATTLGVNLYTDEVDEDGKKVPKEFTKVFEEMMSHFDCAGRKLKKELLKVLSKANQVKEQVNATGTENTETTVQDQEM